MIRFPAGQSTNRCIQNGSWTRPAFCRGSTKIDMWLKVAGDDLVLAVKYGNSQTERRCVVVNTRVFFYLGDTKNSEELRYLEINHGHFHALRSS
jgi:hypothetical protein